jgi:PAS domain S-box-containing protein
MTTDSKENKSAQKPGGFLSRFTGKDSIFFRITAAAVAGSLAILLTCAAIIYMAVREQRQQSQSSRAVEVLRETDSLANDVISADNARFGLLFTGQKAFAEDFAGAEQLAAGRVAHLQAIFSKQPQNLERTAKIGEAIDAWEKTAAKPGVEAVKLGRLAPGTAALASQPASPSVAELRASILSFRTELRSALAMELQDAPSGASLQQALLALPRLQTRLSDTEGARWRFLAAKDQKSLDALNATVREFNTFHGHLNLLLADYPAHLQKLAAIKEGVDRWQQQSSTGTPQDTTALHKSIAEIDASLSAEHDKTLLRAGLFRVLKTLGLVLFCLLALAALIGSSRFSFKSYSRHISNVQSADTQTRSVLSATLDGIITINDQGVIQLINPAAEKLFGVTSGDVVGKSISKLIPQRLLLQDMARIGRGTIMATGQREGFYPFPIEISLSEMPVGGLRHFVAVVRDVTERKHAEEVLQHVGLGISTVTGKDFLRTLIKQLSQAMQSDLAFIVELNRDGLGKPCTMSLAESGQIRAIQKFTLDESVFEEVLRRGFFAKPSGVAKEFPGDRLINELGVEAFIAMPLQDHGGRQVGIMGVMHRRPMDSVETTEATLQIFAARAGAEIERQRFADDLAAEKERLAITLRAIADGFIATDTDGRIIMMNNVAEKLTGWTNDKAAGQPLIEVFRIINERTKTVSQNIIQRIVETGSVGTSSGNLILAANDGTQRIIDANAAPIRDRTNRRTGIVLVFRDITEKQQLEQEHRKAEKLEALGIAAGGIAHDFNNLLTAILGNISLATMELDPDEEAVERLTTAKKASLRAQELAQQLLTFAKGGAPVKKTASIVTLIQDAARLCVRSQGTRLEFSLPETLEPCDVDPGQISQVITNITVNAEHAMTNGGTIRIIGENVFIDDEAAEGLPGRPGRYVKISIRDHGIGIPEEYLKKIFDPYFSTKPQASGLGLATAYSIVKNHHGFITVDSEPGVGSTFSVYLPASDHAIAAEKPSIPVEAYKPGATPPKGKGRILVIDDEEVICSLVTHSLTPLGYEVTETYDASVALKLYEDALKEGNRFDAVISDLTMPGRMSGQEAIKKLLQIDPTVKAIVSSGYATDPVMSRFKEYGFCASLAKPYEVAALGQIVHEVLSASNENQVYHEFVESEMA